MERGFRFHRIFLNSIPIHVKHYYVQYIGIVEQCTLHKAKLRCEQFKIHNDDNNNNINYNKRERERERERDRERERETDRERERERRHTSGI